MCFFFLIIKARALEASKVYLYKIFRRVFVCLCPEPHLYIRVSSRADKIRVLARAEVDEGINKSSSSFCIIRSNANKIRLKLCVCVCVDAPP